MIILAIQVKWKKENNKKSLLSNTGGWEESSGDILFIVDLKSIDQQILLPLCHNFGPKFFQFNSVKQIAHNILKMLFI